MSPISSPNSSSGRTAVERAFFAASTIAFAVFVLRMDGRPTVVFLGVLVVLLVVFGVELRRVELPPGFAITFARRRDAADDECRPASPTKRKRVRDADGASTGSERADRPDDVERGMFEADRE